LAAVAEPVKPTIVLVYGAFETRDVLGLRDHESGTRRLHRQERRTSRTRWSEMLINEISPALYQQTVAQAISNEPQPVVLVGHSFAGFTISAES
jgi:hypothetical protein